MAKQAITAGSRLTGFIRFVVDTRGYGFIRTDDHREFFFNVRNLVIPLPRRGAEKRQDMTGLVGKNVEFTPIARSVKEKNDRAADIRILA